MPAFIDAKALWWTAVYDLYNRRLAAFQQDAYARLLTQGLIGLEKENLRVAANGTIAQTPHPRALGSALTHPNVTTDYSEALIELITAPSSEVAVLLAQLDEIMRVVYAALDEEILWSTSMPCVVEGETSIPIAWYGTSNSGLMKRVYRQGLAYRYGKTMQIIAGVHFNYSFAQELWPSFTDIAGGDARHASKSESYMSLTRNLLRLGWLVPYLFGSSPAVCRSFFPNGQSDLEAFNGTTFYAPFATSLRLSDIGYQNNRESELGINIDYGSLPDYIESMTEAISQPHSEYQRIGVKVGGEYRQLNANRLQIENEYYSTVRVKEIAQRLEKPTTALALRGVRYVELRSLDVSPFDPLGVCESQLRFLELLMTFCLLHDSPPLSSDERREISYNLQQTAVQGRDPDLTLCRGGTAIKLRAWAGELLQQLRGVAEIMDGASGADDYARTLTEQLERVHDSDATPSARVLQEMRDNKESFFEFAMRWSYRHQRALAEHPITAGQAAEYQRRAEQSLAEQAAMEAADDVDFDTFLKEYFASQ
ncbi:MAG: glutamate--cysteine ligase [Gammaproteobacteria bacterium]|nr:glutamate--cysteine ligase [Gammaproteobacteria bacterium]